jgi:hypothetical protein
MGLKELSELQKRISDDIGREIDGVIHDQISSAISVFETVIDDHVLNALGIKTIYASAPITTGFLLYQMLESRNVKSMEELLTIDNDMRKKIMDANIRDGFEFGEELRSKRYPIVIAPGKFFAKGWTQEHYMALWEPTIKRLVRVICFNNKFHYSDGCVEELLIGLQYQKELHIRDGFKMLNLREETHKIADAIDHIEKITGKAPQKLVNNYSRIKEYI